MVFSAAQAAEHKHAPKSEIKDSVAPANTISQESTGVPCAKDSQTCDTRTREDHSRADTAARDHHSEGHHDHGDQVQQ